MASNNIALPALDRPWNEGFAGNSSAVQTLEQMTRSGRLPQTILLHGPEGVGKATLARRFGWLLLGDPNKIELDDLSLEANQTVISEREKLPAEKRNDDPLLFGSHPDFVTFPPDGPLRQITIPQIRLLKARAQYGPIRGQRRIFLIDQIDRANEQAANSLLKILEEPPPYLVVIMTAQNPYDLLPTIRSRSVSLPLLRVSEDEMTAFLRHHGTDSPERRAALAQGSPGLALKFDLATYDARRDALVKLLQTASTKASFGSWAQQAEAMSRDRSEKLEALLPVLYTLIEDLLLLQHGAGPIRNRDMEPVLREIAASVSFEWLRAATKRADELVDMARRNIQKIPALDAMVVDLRAKARGN